MVSIDGIVSWLVVIWYIFSLLISPTLHMYDSSSEGPLTRCKIGLYLRKENKKWDLGFLIQIPQKAEGLELKTPCIWILG